MNSPTTEDFLEKLFWSLASSPQSDNRLPGIPFLNGGLFDDDEFALTQVRKKHNPPLQIRNATFRNVFDNFLEAFHFTVREDTPLNQEVAVDPEMLGKVFESIVLHAEAADPKPTRQISASPLAPTTLPVSWFISFVRKYSTNT